MGAELITIFAPDGIGEVTPRTDLAAEICAAVASDPAGPLTSGDIVVVTSKIISKVEGRRRAAVDRESAIDEESLQTVSRRGPTRIVRTRQGLTLAAAGVDTSNVARGSILLLPQDPDASAAVLLEKLEARSAAILGVIISDTAGRAWRMGQTDQAIGAAGVRVIESYAGRSDSHGNELQVTAMAVADELAAAADLAKAKLAGRPVAVVRGLAHQLTDRSGVGPGEPLGSVDRAAALVRETGEDLFRYGSREAVVAAVLAATDQADRYEEVIGGGTGEALVEAVLAGVPFDNVLTAGETQLLRRVLWAALRW